jgi:thiol-disulfide isomerase/thioredoxin
MNEVGWGQSAACGLVSLAVLCCVALGCSQPQSAATAPSPQESKPPDRVELTPVDRAGLDAVLAGLRGKTVLVDCWATWCGPCVEQLPHSVALARAHAADGLAVVTVNFDDPDAAANVRKVLAAAASTPPVTNLQSRLGSSTESMDAFEISSGALPHYKLIDRTGRLRQTFELDPSTRTQFTPADLDAAVAKLLAQ